MNNLRTIRKTLGLTQGALAKLIGCCPANVSHYETQGQTIKPEVAAKIIAVAKERGLDVTYDYLYGNTGTASEPVQMVKECPPKIAVLFDIFGGHNIVVDGRVFITINYLPPFIDNAGMRRLSADILRLVSGDD